MSAWSEISVVLITRDAAEVLDAALRSIPAEAEVIVADGASGDGTRERATWRGARVVDQDLDAVRAAGGNFDAARNGAARYARRRWVFFLDADERLSDALSEEIGRLDLAAAPVAFDMPRANLYWGRPVRLLGEDRQLRLVRAGRGRWLGSALHEPMRVDGAVGHLGAPLVHENVRSWRDVRHRLRRDRAIGDGPGSRGGIGARARAGLRMFRYYYLGNQAYRDGVRGLVMSLVYAFYAVAIVGGARDEGPASCSTAP